MKFIMSFALLFLLACSGTRYKQPEELPDSFPIVAGESLQEEKVILPTAVAGKDTVLLIGYIQRAQFDIDRWILGLIQAEVDVEIVEVPAISGMFPSAIADYINDGMRSGIPKEDWGDVVTLYSGEARKIKKAFGDRRPQSAQVVLLDKDGKVRWFYNEGYSAKRVLELEALLK